MDTLRRRTRGLFWLLAAGVVCFGVPACALLAGLDWAVAATRTVNPSFEGVEDNSL